MTKEEILECILSGNIMSEEVVLELGKLFDEYYNNFFSPQFIARETGVSRRDLSVWNKEGLLINRNNEQDEEDGWKKYSMIECFWLNIVWKLKKFGVGNTQIIEYKEMLFDSSAESFKNNINESKNHFDLSIESDTEVVSLKQKLNETGKDVIEGILKRFDGTFGMRLMFIALFHLNESLFILESGDIGIINVGNPLNESSERNKDYLLEQIKQQSFIAINLQQIIANFFQNEKLQKDCEFFFGILNAGERQLITEIRSKKLKQVTVKIKDGSITHIRLTKNEKQNEQLIKQLSRLLKKGDYKKIELIAVDGKISYLDEEDIIKL